MTGHWGDMARFPLVSAMTLAVLEDSGYYII